MKLDIGRIVATLLENVAKIDKQKGKTLIIVDKNFNLSFVNENYYTFTFREINSKKLRLSFFDIDDSIIAEIVTITESKEQEIIIKDSIVYSLKPKNITVHEDIVHIEYEIIEKIKLFS